jgi:hypothetical protein
VKLFGQSMATEIQAVHYKWDRYTKDKRRHRNAALLLNPFVRGKASSQTGDICGLNTGKQGARNLNRELGIPSPEARR